MGVGSQFPRDIRANIAYSPSIRLIIHPDPRIRRRSDAGWLGDITEPTRDNQAGDGQSLSTDFCVTPALDMTPIRVRLFILTYSLPLHLLKTNVLSFCLGAWPRGNDVHRQNCRFRARPQG